MIWTVLSGLVSEFVTDWKQKRQHKRELKQSTHEFRQKQATSDQTHKQTWELAVLEGADLWPRRLILLVWLWPLCWAYVDPVAVEHYFNTTLKALPDWYVNGLFLMLSVVWGVSKFQEMRAGK